MKTLDELKTFFDNELLTDLRQLEQKRKQVVTNTLIAIGVITVLGLIVFGVNVSQDVPLIIIRFSLFGVVVIGAIIFYFISRGYEAEFKQRIIGKIVHFLEPGLVYQSDGCIGQSTFTASNLFQHSIDRYQGEDKVQGMVGKTQIAFSEIHAEYVTTSGTGKNRHTEWHTIFKGLFFIADFNKYFQGQTVVLPDVAEKAFGGFGKTLQSWNAARPDLIKLEDPEFEREFVVYGTDQIEARYILSPALMRRILDFQTKTGNKIHLSFTGSKVYVTLPMSKNLFEPKYFTSLTNLEPIAEYYHDLRLAIDIVDDLNLNTRIWTKE